MLALVKKPHIELSIHGEHTDEQVHPANGDPPRTLIPLSWKSLRRSRLKETICASLSRK